MSFQYCVGCLFGQIVECIAGQKLDIVVIPVCGDVHPVGIPVVAAGADAEDASVSVSCREFPYHYGAVTAISEVGCTCACSPCRKVCIPSPVASDMPLCSAVCDLVPGVAGVDYRISGTGVSVCLDAGIERMAFIALDEEAPRACGDFSYLL